MSYPPQEGYPAPATPVPQPPATPPTMQFAAQPQPAPAYLPAISQVSGTPDGSPGARRNSTVLVLAIAAALLLVFGGLMLGLYLNERGNLNETKGNLRDTRADLTTQVQDQKAIVTTQQEKLTVTEKRADDAEKKLQTTTTNLSNVTAERDVLVPCMRRIEEAFDAAATGDSSGTITALRRARTSCDKAERKVDS